MRRASLLTRDPQRLAALCSLWQQTGTELWLTVSGGSMHPCIPDGTRIALSCGQQDFAAGQILAFCSGRSVVVHRLLRCEQDPESGATRLICQGDANPAPDPPVAPAAVLGVVTRIEPPTRAQSCLRRFRRWTWTVRRRAPRGTSLWSS